MGNSVMVPPRVIRPILLPNASVNQRLLSGPAVIATGALWDAVRANSVMVPLGVMRPILLPIVSVNQRLPSGPAVIPSVVLVAVGMGNSVIVPVSFFVGVGVGADGCGVEAPHPTQRTTSSSISTGSNPLRGGT